MVHHWNIPVLSLASSNVEVQESCALRASQSLQAPLQAPAEINDAYLNVTLLKGAEPGALTTGNKEGKRGQIAPGTD